MTYSHANGRYICSASSHTFSDLTKILAELFPDLVMVFDDDQNQEIVPHFSTEKIKKELGMTFVPIKDTLKKSIEALKSKGFVPSFS